MKNAGIAYPW